MKYMGSKSRIAKYILPIILKDRKDGQYYVEPFCGGSKKWEMGVVLLRLWQVPMGMDILLPVLTVCMILWNKL